MAEKKKLEVEVYNGIVVVEQDHNECVIHVPDYDTNGEIRMNRGQLVQLIASLHSVGNRIT